jgi:hypothetical protein
MPHVAHVAHAYGVTHDICSNCTVRPMASRGRSKRQRCIGDSTWANTRLCNLNDKQRRTCSRRRRKRRSSKRNKRSMPPLAAHEGWGCPPARKLAQPSSGPRRGAPAGPSPSMWAEERLDAAGGSGPGRLVGGAATSGAWLGLGKSQNPGSWLPPGLSKV